MFVFYKLYYVGYAVYLENVANNDTLSLKAARRDAIANFLGFEYELQTNPMPFHFRFAVGRHVNAAYSVCNGQATEQNTESG